MKIIISPYSRPLRNGKNNPKNFPWWKDVVRELKNRGHYIIQIGRTGEIKIDGVDEVKYSLSLKELGKLVLECDTWIAVDNFFPHFCHHYNKKGIVIFGQSDPEIYGYPENNNLLKSRGYLREKQFDIWEAIHYKKEAFIDALTVVDSIN